jgi:hypothetical protein
VAETLNDASTDSDRSIVVVTVAVIDAQLILGMFDGDEIRDDESWADADADVVVDSLTVTETDGVSTVDPEFDEYIVCVAPDNVVDGENDELGLED